MSRSHGCSQLTPLPLLKQQDDEQLTPESPRKETAQHNQCALELKHIMLISRNGFVLDHPVPIGTSQWMILLLALSQQTRLALHHKQPEMMEHGFIFSRKMQHITIIMCKI